MSNHFDSHGGQQSAGIGEHAIGQQNNLTQEVRGDGNISSGTGNVTVHQNVLLKPRTVLLASALAAAVFAGGLAAWHWLAPKPPPVQNNSIVMEGNQNKGPTALAQGTGATVNQTNNYYGGVSQQRFEELRDKYAVTNSALASFFKIMEQQQVAPGDLDSKLREIATQYKELLARVGDDQAAKQAIEAGNYAKAEELLEDIARQHNLAAAEANADNARLQRVQLRYAKAAAYWQKAAALLPEDEKKERARYLNEAGYDLDRIAKYKEALPLYEQSLVFFREIGDKAGEGTTLNNIGQIYKARGDYDKALPLFEQSVAIFREAGSRAEEGTLLNNIGQIYKARGDYATALKYLEQSLSIRQEIDDKAGEGTTLNNIATTEYAKGDYATALKYLEQSLAIDRELGDKAGEDCTLNNISQIYDARGDYATALKYLEQALAIQQEIGNRYGQVFTNWNIGRVYSKQDELTKAESYMSRAVQLAEELGHPSREKYREGLERVRAKLRGK